MKRKILSSVLSLVMALCLCASLLAVPGLALNQPGGLSRKAGDIQPMTFDYVRKNINTMVQGMTNKYVLKGSTNIDLSRDVYILDPRIVSIRVDTSDVDWNTYGVYPIRYTVCFKPATKDQYSTLSYTAVQARVYDKDAKLGGRNDGGMYDQAFTNRSECYPFTDCASRLKNDEYVTLTFGAVVHVGAPSYLDDFVKQAVPVYQSNTQMYSTSKAPAAPARYYQNLAGTFSMNSYTVKTSFKLMVGEAGYHCNRCGKKFTYTGVHSYIDASYADDAASSHKCDDGKNHGWATFSGHCSSFSAGDSFHVEVFTLRQ